MNILAPEFLALVPLVIFALWLLFKKDETHFFYTRADELKKITKPQVDISKYFFAGSLLFVFIALLRPAKGIVKGEETKDTRDIFLVLDTSPSMEAIDIKPSRIEVAKEKAIEFVKKRTYDRIGIVVFGGIAFVHCPLTFDHRVAVKLLKEIQTGMTRVDGTAIGDGIAVAVKHLAKSPSKSKVIVLLTDGANNRGTIMPEGASSLAKEIGIKIYSIGIGTKGPAYIPYEDPVFGKRLVRIKDELDEELLRKIAKETSGRYFRASSKEEFSKIYSEIDKLERTKIHTTSFIKYKEFGLILTKIAFVLFAFGFVFRFVLIRKIP